MLFYKIGTPVGKILMRNCAKKEGCYCYNYYQYHKRMTMEQFNNYQDCRDMVQAQKPAGRKRKLRNDMFLL